MNWEKEISNETSTPELSETGSSWKGFNFDESQIPKSLKYLAVSDIDYIQKKVGAYRLAEIKQPGDFEIIASLYIEICRYMNKRFEPTMCNLFYSSISRDLQNVKINVIISAIINIINGEIVLQTWSVQQLISAISKLAKAVKAETYNHFDANQKCTMEEAEKITGRRFVNLRNFGKRGMNPNNNYA